MAKSIFNQCSDKCIYRIAIHFPLGLRGTKMELFRRQD